MNIIIIKQIVLVSALTFGMLILTSFTFNFSKGNLASDKIVGKWINSKKDLVIEISKESNYYIGKIIWFKCYNEKSMSDFKDSKNPNSEYRNRAWLGLEVLTNLKYQEGGKYVDGKIYDPNSGHTFSSNCSFVTDNTLKVHGYYCFEWLGKDLIFNKY